MKEKREARRLWHEFTRDELVQRGLDLAVAFEAQERVEIAKAEANKAFKERTEALREEIKTLGMMIKERGEHRNIECLVRFNSPRVGTKEMFRIDSGEKVGEEVMTPAECQENLFEEQPKTEAAIV